MPRNAPSEAELERTSTSVVPYPDPVEGEYDWSREFSYRRDKSSDAASATYAFMLQGKQATYVKVNHSFVLGKRRRKDMMNVPIPEQVCITALTGVEHPKIKYASFRPL